MRINVSNTRKSSWERITKTKMLNHRGGIRGGNPKHLRLVMFSQDTLFNQKTRFFV